MRRYFALGAGVVFLGFGFILWTRSGTGNAIAGAICFLAAAIWLTAR